MATWTGKPHTAEVLEAAATWREQCFLGSGSLFSTADLWTLENFQALKSAFIDNPLSGSGKFIEKLTSQLEPASAETKRLAAEVLWLLLLFVTSEQYGENVKRLRVKQIWELGETELPESELFSDEVLCGLAKPGTAFMTMLPKELTYLINLMISWKSLPSEEQASLLTAPWSMCSWSTSQPDGDRRVFRHMLLYFLFPADFERCCSWEHKRKILMVFGKAPGKGHLRDFDSLCDIDKALLALRQELETDYGTAELDFYIEPLRARWRDLVEGEEAESVVAEMPLVWIEKTIVKNRADRLEGDHALGKALWSPQRSKSNGDIYSNMREVKAGDVILHLTDNEAISAASIAAEGGDDSFRGVDGTEWGNQPSYRIALRDHVVLDPPLHRSTFFDTEPFSSDLRDLKANGLKGLFFNNELALNQGSYLTVAPTALVQILNAAYQSTCGHDLPYVAAALGESVEGDATQNTADRIREYALARYIDPARQRGDRKVTIIAGVLHNELNLQAAHANVCQALGGSKFQKLASVAPPTVEGPNASSTTKYTFLISVAEDVDIYGPADALSDLFMDGDELSELLTLWKTKKNVILQGPPGVGKSFAAQRLAYTLIGRKAKKQLGFVQFHQSYAYEDFVEGFRPNENGFVLRQGKFVEFCRRATSDLDNRYVFIIDEINRGNLSKILGELMLLIEPDKRDEDWAMTLAYGDTPFYVPDNVYLLGLMNTADRSLAVVDYALRRRFAFVDIEPKIGSDKFQAHLEENGVSLDVCALLLKRIAELNLEIIEDVANLGRGFAIGHSFFCKGPVDGEESAHWYSRIIRTEILPLLREYWFDAPDTVQSWEDRLLAGL